MCCSFKHRYHVVKIAFHIQTRVSLNIIVVPEIGYLGRKTRQEIRQVFRQPVSTSGK
jgi:hypothetical protein